MAKKKHVKKEVISGFWTLMIEGLPELTQKDEDKIILAIRAGFRCGELVQEQE